MRPSKGAIHSRDFSGLGSGSMAVHLVTGVLDQENTPDRRVVLEPLTGRDEEAILSTVAGDRRLPKWVDRVLGRKVNLSGRPLGEAKAGTLSVIDRDLLILYLRMLTFGNELWGITRCPEKGCGAKLDFTFDLGSLKVPERKKSPAVRSSSVMEKDREIQFQFREPDGSDQNMIADLVSTDARAAWLTLMSRCIIRWEGQNGMSVADLSRLPPAMLDQVDAGMADAMDTMDWDIAFTCAQCKGEFIRTLDIQAYFWEELHHASVDFLEEVHQLAFFYHWSEREILELTRWKRKMYLGLIKSQLNQ